MMRGHWLLAALGLFHLATAQVTPAVPQVEVAPGSFAALTFTTQGTTDVTVTYPPFVTLMGAPTVTGSRVTIFLYVAADAPFGAHEVTVDATGSLPLSTTILVARRVGIEVLPRSHETIVQGEVAALLVTIRNSGNSREQVEVRARSTFDLRQTLAVVELDPGEAREVTFESAGGVTAGQDAAVIVATLLSDPTKRSFAVVRTTVLPFAGFEAHDGPSMQYRLEVVESYGSSGWRTQATAALEGELSDSVGAAAHLAGDWSSAGNARAAGHVEVVGNDWSARFDGTPAGQRLAARYGDLTAYSVLGPGTFGIGASYVDEALQLSASHTAGPYASQAISAGYNFSVTPEWTLTPSISGLRATRNGTTMSGSAAISASLSADSVLGAFRLQSSLPFDAGWRLDASVTGRRQAPVAFRGDLALTSRSLYANLTVNEVLSDEVTLSQRLSYDGSSRFAFGVRYSPRSFPLRVRADGALTHRAGLVGASYSAAVSYQLDPFTVSGFVGGDVGAAPSYGGSLSYRTGEVEGSVAYRRTGASHLASTSLSWEHAKFSGSADYRYDFASNSHSGRFGAAYSSPDGYALFGGLNVGSALSWEVGARVSLAGGFTTPESIIEAFGGREGGIVSGTVFLDVNRNGIRDPGDSVLEGVTVHLAGSEGITDAAGAYRVVVPSGTYRPRVSGVAASLGLVGESTVIVSRDSRFEVDLPLQTVGAVVVTVFEDANRNGVKDPGEEPATGLTVRLEALSGETHEQPTSSAGEALFQGLAPGAYVARLPATARFVPQSGTAESVTLEVQPGPPSRVELAVAPSVPEVVTTLERGEVSMFATIDPSPAPPGAHVLVSVALAEDATVSAGVAGHPRVGLSLRSDGTYSGRLPLPDTTGVALVIVTAEVAGRSLEQAIPVIVAAGPLAQVRTTPALADPGQSVSVQVRLLTPADRVHVMVAGEVVQLASESDPYVFTGMLFAPVEAGSYPIEVVVDGVMLVEGRFRVH